MLSIIVGTMLILMTGETEEERRSRVFKMHYEVIQRLETALCHLELEESTSETRIILRRLRVTYGRIFSVVTSDRLNNMTNNDMAFYTQLDKEIEELQKAAAQHLFQLDGSSAQVG
jgi:hypothetical protein